jgi:hypothetical protein
MYCPDGALLGSMCLLGAPPFTAPAAEWVDGRIITGKWLRRRAPRQCSLAVMARRGLDPRGSAPHPDLRRGRNERYANASSRYPSAATASQRVRKAGWPPL